MTENSEIKERSISFLIVLALFVSIPLKNGGIGLSWDSLNHHIYLGWVASEARFDRDYFAAGSQSYQFPYLYWPIYQMTQWRWPGWLAGVVWASLHALVSFPLWHCARTFISEGGVDAAVYRVAAVVLGVGGILVLRAAETTGNDLLAAYPLIWACALSWRQAAMGHEASGKRAVLKAAVLIGLLGGLSAALKLSNAILAPLLLLLFFMWPQPWRARLSGAAVCMCSMTLGFLVAYGWWGWQLWKYFGNPLFPFGDFLFSSIRNALGWTVAN